MKPPTTNHTACHQIGRQIRQIGTGLCVLAGIALVAMSGAAIAGDREVISGKEVLSGKEPLVLNDEEPALVKPTLDSRMRYEYGDQAGRGPSNASTWRNRVGLLTRKVSGFQLFAEYEGTMAVDRGSYNAAGIHGDPSRTVVADPESHELNQLWASYEGFDGFATIKAGRQGINLHGQRFIGTVGWRQNMQSYDAAAVTLHPSEDLEIYYGYLWQVNRIFGSQVDETLTPALGDFNGNSHIFNANYDGLSFGRLTAYAYILDLGNDAGDTNSNNTFGLRLTGNVLDTALTYHAEYAYQTDAFDSPLDYATHYAHGNLGVPLIEGVKGTVGMEYLGSNNNVGFKTPLATLHKWNGFADSFLNTPASGLTDLYGRIDCKLPFDVSGSFRYHQFWDASLDTSFGNEFDVVMTKEIRKGVLLLAKAGLLQGGGGVPDVNRAILEMNFKF